MEVLKLPIEDVLNSFGTGEYAHAFTGTAIALYMKYLKNKGDRKSDYINI